MLHKIHFLSTILILVNFTSLRAQDNIIPIQPDLERNSEQWLIKVGMINKKKPPKVKFGEYTTEEREGKLSNLEKLRFGDPEDSDQSLEFSFTLINRKNDSVYVEAFSEGNNGKEVNDLVVYMASSVQPEELWILMLSRSPGSNNLSEGSMVMTNGTEEITFRRLTGEKSGKDESSAPKGIEIYQENLSIGAMQYDSGATFGYRKFIWINQKASEQMQLLAASIFPVLLEVGGYFEQTVIVD